MQRLLWQQLKHVRKQPSLPCEKQRELQLQADSLLQRQQLSSSDLLFHEAAVAALCGGSAGGGCCGWGLQQQALLLGARLLGREQRLQPLLPPAGSGHQEQSVPSSGGLASTEALAHLQALRTAGRMRGSSRVRLLAAGAALQCCPAGHAS